MKLFSTALLAFSLSTDAFVIQGSKPTSPSTSSLKDVSLQWGFDENGCRNEYYLEHWTEQESNVPQSNWAYDPWSGVSQVVFIPRHNEVIEEVQARFASQDILGAGASQMSTQTAPAQRQAASLPPAQPARTMPAQPMPNVNAAAPHYAAHGMMN